MGFFKSSDLLNPNPLSVRTVSRTTVHSAHNRAVQYKGGPQVKRTPLCVRIPTRDAWAEHKPEGKNLSELFLLFLLKSRDSSAKRSSVIESFWII